MFRLFLLFLLGAAVSQSQDDGITIDLDAFKPSGIVHGIFFEEISHAGDGGLYGELIQDRSFDALAKAYSFHAEGQQLKKLIDLTAVPHASSTFGHLNATEDPPLRWPYESKKEFVKSRPSSLNVGPIVAWQAFAGGNPNVSTLTYLTSELPISPQNNIALELSSPGSTNGEIVGVVNSGYWGISVHKGNSYTLSLFARSVNIDTLYVSLLDGSGIPLATQSVNGLQTSWKQVTMVLNPKEDATDASLALTFEARGTNSSITLDSVSFFPSENIEKARELGHINPWPFRKDLLEALKALHPRFLRFPGGCYVEGDVLENAFLWKKAIGDALTERSGHWNGVWSYYSTDGLGLFEYLLLAEELNAEPIWVINAGISHKESIPGKNILPWVQDALDSLEFMMGGSDTAWGSVRTAMGHKDPWNITYMAVGNENCGLPWDAPHYMPFYMQNYLAFYSAIKVSYPHMRLISNCDMKMDAPTDIWEYHVYTNPTDLFNRRKVFDSYDRHDGDAPQVFASEYAVTDGGGWGNLIGAVAEAGFMTGLEKNNDLVVAASYAPLFVHTNNRPWPTNMIVFDNHRYYTIPSYHVQQMFAKTLGSKVLKTDAQGDNLAASATCLDDVCAEVAVRIVNFSNETRSVDVLLKSNGFMSLEKEAQLEYLTSESPQDENTFENPARVAPRQDSLTVSENDRLKVGIKAWSVTLVTLKLGTIPSAAVV